MESDVNSITLSSLIKPVYFSLKQQIFSIIYIIYHEPTLLHDAAWKKCFKMCNLYIICILKVFSSRELMY